MNICRSVLAAAAALGLLAAVPAPASPAAAAPRTNFVFVLTDDLSKNLVQYMPNVQALAAEGTTFANYTVTDSLCCPSRSSIFTGRFPHNTGIYTNGGDDGGFGVFHQRGEESDTFATDLTEAGYRTAFLGKYLNGYLPADGWVPPGWTEWDVAGAGYAGYNYNLLENGTVRHYGSTPADYLTRVISGKAQRFITDSAAAGKPFLIELATFTPHSPYTPDPQDLDRFPNLTAPRGPAFNTLPANAPAWLAAHDPLTADEKTKIDNAYRKRAQAVQSIDRMIGTLRQTLEAAGVAGHTVLVFSSDNGYHMGQYRLNPGKQTAFDTDVNVPLIVAGGGVRAGITVTAPAANIDLRPTFTDLAGTTTGTEVDGRSLKPLLTGPAPAGWRTTALIEHHGPDVDPSDPDLPEPGSGNPPTYNALRTATYTYVEYRNGAAEYYDRTADPHQLNNIVGTLSAARLAELHAAVDALHTCVGRTACWR
ncbi:hypothetical protein GCM10010168_34330 [Actinoplanes ianthinogenes]|uniref:Sulfatase N-terminal domain-containing protein n=1 Tax=Actinoplanes ianthinogenes TaxID=122358 RepID=A0ABN6CPC7_9ACTN|nr:sulfatase-like hydrolase/transferase [Actinoplanes ianthinogenes]BCJ47047.1 hypothetical protein Aiant_77040 [Actinoplanes ianthinogenes]GGR13664.1 hypothetical protein GCM10010168_34330 [Actinoplanes ianthinogenes]